MCLQYLIQNSPKLYKITCTVDCRLLCVPSCTVHYITLVAAPTGTVLTTYTAVAVTLVVMEWLCNSAKLEAEESRR